MILSWFDCDIYIWADEIFAKMSATYWHIMLYLCIVKICLIMNSNLPVIFIAFDSKSLLVVDSFFSAPRQYLMSFHSKNKQRSRFDNLLCFKLSMRKHTYMKFILWTSIHIQTQCDDRERIIQVFHSHYQCQPWFLKIQIHSLFGGTLNNKLWITFTGIQLKSTAVGTRHWMPYAVNA